MGQNNRPVKRAGKEKRMDSNNIHLRQISVKHRLDLDYFYFFWPIAQVMVILGFLTIPCLGKYDYQLECATIVHKKKFGAANVNLIVHELTKPESTSCPQIFCQACVRHMNKVCP